MDEQKKVDADPVDRDVRRASDAEIAIERLTAWVRDHSDAKPQVFIGDVTMVLMLARAYMREHP